MLEFIVGRLREEPFGIAIRAVSMTRCTIEGLAHRLCLQVIFTGSPFISLISTTQVDFDGKRPDEHLQILNDVIASLMPDLKADVRASSRDEIVDKMRLFLMTHKCKCLPNDEGGFSTKEAMYPVLHWVLSEYENLRKRTYLSRYLMPVDVPVEYLSMQTSGDLLELLDAYKELQEEVRCCCPELYRSLRNATEVMTFGASL